MQIEKISEGTQLTLQLAGRLDTVTASEFEAVCGPNLKNISLLIIDCSGLVYVSSAGLRVLLAAHKTITEHGRMVVRNVNAEVMEVFDMTGFTDLLHFE